MTPTDESTKQKLSVRTNDEGEFTFPLDKGGRYTIDVEAVGFPKYKFEQVELSAAESARADVTLQANEFTETIGIFDSSYGDRSPVKTREGTTTINADALRGVRPRD